jgi:hypothetical protein
LRKKKKFTETSNLRKLYFIHTLLCVCFSYHFNVMGGLFSSEPSPLQPTAHDKAMLDLKHQQDQLKITQKRVRFQIFFIVLIFYLNTQIQKVIERETEMAKTLLTQGKRKQVRENISHSSPFNSVLGSFGVEKEKISRKKIRRIYSYAL